MSLNLLLPQDRLVLRVHQQAVSKGRLLELQQLRIILAEANLQVPIPALIASRSIFAIGSHLAELDHYLPSEEFLDSEFGDTVRVTANLHRLLVGVAVPLRRPHVATFASPSTLGRWGTLALADCTDDSAYAMVERIVSACAKLRSIWIPQSQLAIQIIHGDLSAANLGRRGEDLVIYDFGFAAYRPRVFDLSYGFVAHVRKRGLLGGIGVTSAVNDAMDHYCDLSDIPLSGCERASFWQFAISICLYQSLVQFISDPNLSDTSHSSEYMALADSLIEAANA